MAVHEPAAVMLVDDHQLFAQVLARRLRAEPEFSEVTVARSLSEAREVSQRAHPDLVLLDFHLEGESGIGLLDDLGHLDKLPAVLMLSASEDSESIVAALEAGAQGWVSKDEDFTLLVQAIRRVQAGQMHLPGDLARLVVRRLLDQTRGQTRDPSFVQKISPRELAVLQCLVAGMTRTEVAERLYVSPNTVRTHIHKLLRTAGLHSTLSLVAAARRSGVEAYDEVPHAVSGVAPADSV
jgi:DNA-binding NarL/FixJ family response regulator